MALILQLKPDLEETLRAQANAQGLSLEDYVQSLIERGSAHINQQRRLTPEEFAVALDSIAAHADKIPELPPEALTREGIYRNHD